MISYHSKNSCLKNITVMKRAKDGIKVTREKENLVRDSGQLKVYRGGWFEEKESPIRHSRRRKEKKIDRYHKNCAARVGKL